MNNKITYYIKYKDLNGKIHHTTETYNPYTQLTERFSDLKYVKNEVHYNQ